MLDKIVIVLAAALGTAGVISLVIAKRMLREYFSWMEQAQRSVPRREVAESLAQPIPSTRFGDFARVPPSPLMIHHAGATRNIEVGTRVY